jgi:competence protein ComEC
MPIVSMWVMPVGLLALIALPFGFDGMLWRLMGDGIDWMIAVALWVAHLPGAVGRIPAFGIGALLLCTGGLALLCLLKSPLRWCGALLIGLACIAAGRTPLPDILVAADGRAVAVRGADGRLAIHRTGRDAFAVREWLAADGDARLPADPALQTGYQCDEDGCIAKLLDGRLVSHVLAPDAFAEDCTRAAVVVSAREASPQCQAYVVDRKVWRARGAIALRRDGKGFRQTEARPAGTDRPWARSPDVPSEAAQPAARPTARDATPRSEDLEAGD